MLADTLPDKLANKKDKHLRAWKRAVKKIEASPSMRQQHKNSAQVTNISGDRSIGKVMQLVTETEDSLLHEIGAVKMDMTSSIQACESRIQRLVLTNTLINTAIIFSLIGVVMGLSVIFPLWLAFLAAGSVVLSYALFLIYQGKKESSDRMIHDIHTIRSL